jgi:hypothetical protein
MCSNVFFVFVLSWFEFKDTSKALEPFKDQIRSYVAIWESIHRFGSSSHIYNNIEEYQHSS